MAQTYRQKYDELRLKSLQIIEEGLSHSDPLMKFICASQFLAANNADFDKPLPEQPDALDAEEISDEK